MTKSAKRKLVYILCLLFSFVLITKSSIVIRSIELNKNIELIISCVNNKKTLSGAEFSIYKIGDADYNGGIKLADEFKNYPVDFKKDNYEQWNEYAETLKSNILKDNIKPLYNGKTDTGGKLSFKVERGVYLVVGEDFLENDFKYRTSPYIVSLPEYDENTGRYLYKTNSEPKFKREEIPLKKISINVLKIWEDSGYEDIRPESIEVELIGNSKVEDTVKLNRKNNWSFTWEKLDPSIKWTVLEKSIDKNKYTVKLEEQNNNFLITNSYKIVKTPPKNGKVKTPPEKISNGNKIPQTGQLWWPVYVLSGIGVTSILLGFVEERMKGDRNEE